ncbi:MAG: hypothetical protein GQ574_23955 [Crocinitomix sp.]|nr:hypothetical protein [Crocinitomix sp.]
MTTSSSTKWTTNGTQILKDGNAVFLNGVCYSPTPCGAATYAPGVGDWFATPWDEIWERDFPLMKAAGIDNIRTYFFWAWTPPADMTTWRTVVAGKPTFDHTAFLAAAAKYDISVTIGIALDGGNIFDNAVPGLGQDYLNFYKSTAVKLAELYGDNPAVMGFCIGNEQNNPSRIVTSDFWDDLSNIAGGVKATAPDKLVMLAMQNEDGMYEATVGTSNPGSPFSGKSVPEVYSDIFDVWGVNIYSGMSGSLADYNTYVVNSGYSLPLIVSEWGIPAANTSGELTPAEFAAAITNTMNPRGADMKANVSFVAGAQYFEWTDEWWKGNGGATPAVHTNPTNNQWTEEWWGLNSIAPNGRTAADGPWDVAKKKPYPADTITARPTLAALTALYSGITPS